MPQDAQFRKLRLRRGQHGERIVAARIVDEYDFEIGHAAKRGRDLGQQRDDIVALVVHRHDYG